jgi:hypothetical protein
MDPAPSGVLVDGWLPSPPIPESARSREGSSKNSSDETAMIRREPSARRRFSLERERERERIIVVMRKQGCVHNVRESQLSLMG